MNQLNDKSRLPVSLIIAVKAFFLYILFFNYGLINPLSYNLPFLPFISFLDAIPASVYNVLSVILGISVILPILLKKHYQVFAFTSGFVVLFFILSSKILFSNSLTFVASFLLLSGLYFGSTYIFNIQISLLYLGAAVNKLFSPDWWNGIFIDYLLRDILEISLYQYLIPDGEKTVAMIMGISVMVTELLLGVLVLIPKCKRLVIKLGLLFHGVMFILTAGALSLFFLYAMSAAFIAISGFRTQQMLLSGGSSVINYILCRLDFTDTITAQRAYSANRFALRKAGSTFTGRNAWKELIFSAQTAVWLWFAILIGWFLIPKVVEKVMPLILA